MTDVRGLSLVCTDEGVENMWVLPHMHERIAKRIETINDVNFIFLFGVAGYGIVLLSLLAFMALIKIACF
jgi:hypothetical protein